MDDTQTDILNETDSNDSVSEESTSSTIQTTQTTTNTNSDGVNVVFVGSLAWATTDESLRAHFENAGLQIGEDEVVKNDMTGKEYTRRAVVVARYPDTKKSRGYGFVTLASAEEAQKAVETLNGTELDGREIRVQLKDMTPREERPRRDNFRSSNRYGGNDRFGGERRGRDNFRRNDNYNRSEDSWAA